METETPTKCFQCRGPYHPATGDYNAAFNIAFCGACIRPFYQWFKAHTKRKWGKENFYEHAVTSIKAK